MMNLVISNAPSYSIDVLSHDLRMELDRNAAPNFAVKFYEYFGDLVVSVYVFSEYLLRHAESLSYVRLNLSHRDGAYKKTVALDSFAVDSRDKRVFRYNCKSCFFEPADLLTHTNFIVANVDSEEYLVEKNSLEERILQDGFALHNYNRVDCNRYVFNHYGEKYYKLYCSLNSRKSKTDFFLFCFLYNEGGLYINTDIRRIFDEKNIKYGKVNGVVFYHNSSSSFISARFEKGFLYLSYLLDKLVDSQDDLSASGLSLKYQKDYDEFIERQVNLMGSVHSDELDFLDNKFVMDYNYNMHSYEMFYKKIIYWDNNFYIFENSCDKLCSVRIVKIKTPKYYVVYIQNMEPASGCANTVLTFVNGYYHMEKTFSIDISTAFWIKSDDYELEYPDLQHMKFDSWDGLCKRLAIYFYEKKLHDISRKFFKQITSGEHSEIVYYNEDMLNMYISVCGDDPKHKTLVHFLGSKLFSQRKPVDIDLGKRLLRFCRTEQLYGNCNYYYSEVYREIRMQMEECKDHERRELEKHLAEIFYEYIVFAAYTGVSHVQYEIVYLLNHCEHYYMKEGSIYNLKYYKDSLRFVDVYNISEKFVKYDGIKFRSSSCSFVKDGDYFLLNKRFVNYEITPEGGYNIPEKEHGEHHNKYITVNKYCKYTRDWTLVDENIFETEMNNVHIMNTSYICEGIEDLKIFRYMDTLYYLGTICFDNKYNISIGTYDVDGKHIEMRPTVCGENFVMQDVEKNWCFIQGCGRPYFVYKWKPLTICEIDFADNSITTVKTHETPALFEFARGSTNLVRWQEDEYLGIIHIVDYNQQKKRHYYHCFVALDKNFELKSYSNIYTFKKSDIEYSLGLDVDPDHVYVSFSCNDSSSFIGKCARDYVSSILINQHI
jgi:hypothetical protein